jgi:hypothetical protein
MTRGLPSRLPAGEQLLWQGAPKARVLLRSMFHLRMVAAYFAMIILWCVVSDFREGEQAATVALSAARMAGVALVPLSLMTIYAWAVQRSTVYTITSKRVVMHFGVAFPMSFNIPYSKIASAALTANADGSGDIPLQLLPGQKLAYLVMWPNVRPWRMKRPEPMLRGLADVQPVAQLLARALAASASMPVAPIPVATRAADATVGEGAALAA